MRDKKIILFGITIFLVVFLTGFISAVCCEKTKPNPEGSVFSCMDVTDENLCDDGFRTSLTACASTSYCSAGTCVNSRTGKCLPSSQTTCDPTLGGYWYNKDVDDVAECQLGCCLIGDGAALVEQILCNTMASDYNVEAEFRRDIQNQFECLAMAGPKAKGACIFETERGRSCTIETRKDCQDSTGEFHEGFLCSAPELGTICAMTKRTTCVEGKNEVFFEDSCGNIANVYDSNKVEDIEYWTYIKDPTAPSETCGVGSSNADSKTCGNCDYILGSTCGAIERGESVTHGNYICKDLSCKKGKLAAEFKSEKGRYPEHGESWCSEPIENFENAKPGQISYRLYCYNWKIQYELCDHFRQKLCLENENIGVGNCVVNNWQLCTGQNNTEDCENIRDCRVEEGRARLDEDGELILIKDSGSDEMIEAICVPLYPPAFDFWEPETDATGVCSEGSSSCEVIYVKTATDRWRAADPEKFGECVEKRCKVTWEKWTNIFRNIIPGECEQKCARENPSECLKNEERGKLDEELDLKSGWVKDSAELCISLGDCGVKSNYFNKAGYNKWEDLFIGNYTKDSLKDILS